MVPADIDLLALSGGRADDAAERIRMEAASQRLRGVAALRFLWQDFLIPLGTAMIPQIDALVSEFRPDVVVADQQAVGASAVRPRRPHTSRNSPAEPDSALCPRERGAGVRQWTELESGCPTKLPAKLP